MLLQFLPSSGSSDLYGLGIASSHSHQVARNSSRFHPFLGGLNQDDV